MDDDYDELDDMIMQRPSEGERVKKEHEMLDKAASHPIRRKMVKTIGAFGKPEEQLKAELEVDDDAFKYHMDFLKNANIVVIKEDIYRLTDAGIDLLAATEHHREV
ncbi:hypothetical protein [Methanococcoides sp. FTZ1]|uniref:hypothetical protein n=1 Tax=Methanococcoides sp. FTZ1 TaxID=3439061 RepID=UPI003F826F89